jgi:hypothetical protein
MGNIEIGGGSVVVTVKPGKHGGAHPYPTVVTDSTAVDNGAAGSFDITITLTNGKVVTDTVAKGQQPLRIDWTSR